jgi:hypothetical protein
MKNFWTSRKEDLKAIARRRPPIPEVDNWPVDSAGYPIPTDPELSLLRHKPSQPDMEAEGPLQAPKDSPRTFTPPSPAQEDELVS